MYNFILLDLTVILYDVLTYMKINDTPASKQSIDFITEFVF